MGMKYVRDFYGVPAKRGCQVEVLDLAGNKTGVKGVITSARHNLAVRLDGEKQTRRYHPDTLHYCC